MTQESLVKNASNEGQVRAAQKRAKDREGLFVSDLRRVLNTPEGRKVLWHILEHCKVFHSIWESSARIHYNAGVQDVGHYVLGEIMKADENIFLTMMKENKEG